MDFPVVIDQTVINGPPSFQEYRGKNATLLSERSAFSFEPTDMVGPKTVTIVRQNINTPTESERQRFRKETTETAGPTNDSPVAAASESRIALLVQRYEGKSTREDSARLEILTQRIRRLSPRVTTNDLDVLTVMVDEIEEISLGLDELRKKFGVA